MVGRAGPQTLVLKAVGSEVESTMETLSPDATRADAPRPPHDLLRLYGIAVVVGIFMVEGLLRTAYFYLNELAEGVDVPLRAPLVNELTGSVAVIVGFFAVVLPASRRFPLWGARWRVHLPVHLVGLVVFSALKTLLMWGLRLPLWPILGLGSYDYGVMAYRFPMEAANDVLGYFVFVGIVQLWDTWVARQERELREAKLEAAYHQARLQALQGQLQPHFLFNTLNTISSVMYGDPGQADRLMSRLSDLLRSSLAAPERPEVSLEEELEILDRYVELMAARFGDRMTVSVEISSDARASVVPMFLLQPLVENAIQHGVAKRSGPGRVEVKVDRVGERLRIVVADDGPGIDGDPAAVMGKGVGLRNTEERLHHLYGAAASLALRNGEVGGLRVIVEVPHREAQDEEPAGIGAGG
jgi:signal transduction histidine kinase